MIAPANVGSSVRDLPLWLTHFLPPLPLLLEAVTLAMGKPTHDRFFPGEFGVYEIGSVILPFIGVGISLAILFWSRGSLPKQARILVGLLGLGGLYMGGEEASWGQHIFGWDAPDVFADYNYQAETNLHNLWDVPITNVLPRLMLTIGIFVGGLWGPLKMHRKNLDPKRPGYWIWPTAACFVTALFVLIPPIPKKFKWPAMPEPGETEEFYMALFMVLYLASILIRKRQLANQVSSDA